MNQRIESWGRFPKTQPSRLQVPLHRTRVALGELATPNQPAVIHGNGRSYGDVALMDQGTVIHTQGLDRFVHFDRDNGVLRAEAGVLISDILNLIVPHHWFLPVVPGTRYVSLGGAVANDVHGKNHHHAGSFGHHVRALELVRSDGSRLICSAESNAHWLAATIGGLGLTGLITWVEVVLKPIPSPTLKTHTTRFNSLSEFFAMSQDQDDTAQYSVAWVDCMASGAGLGRGRYSTGSFTSPARQASAPRHHRWLRMPFAPAVCPIQPWVVRAFNAVYYRRAVGESDQHYQRFLTPLDGIGNWNRLYGQRGFVQHQCVLPPASAEPALRELLEQISRAKEGSFLAVLKRFGDLPPAGLLSFPRPGVTLALDFPFRGNRTRRLIRALDAIVADANGAIYPAKDALTGPELLRQSLPRLDEFNAYRDDALSSDLWRRLEAKQ